MQPLLILSKDGIFINRQIKDLIKKLAITPYDILDFNSNETIGIENIKLIIKNSRITPYSAKKLTVVRNFQMATNEAQNAFLKFLEEAPAFLTIILTANSIQNILPTVLSRCLLIKDKTKKISSAIDLLPIMHMPKGQRLVYLQKEVTSKDQALRFIADLTDTLEFALLSDPKNFPLSESEIANMIKKTEKARQYLESNVNYKLVLDILLLGFPHVTSV